MNGWRGVECCWEEARMSEVPIGTGNLEVTLNTLADLDATKPFINAKYVMGP